MKIIALAVLFFIFSKCDADDSDYVKNSTCKVGEYITNCYKLFSYQNAKSCLYEYTVDVTIKGGERVDVSANVYIFCESGLYLNDLHVHVKKCTCF